MYEIIFTHRAIRNLKEIDRETLKRIKAGIEGLSSMPPKGDIKKLKGNQGELRLRIGDWRVIFSYDFKNRKVNVLEILPRREAYR